MSVTRSLLLVALIAVSASTTQAFAPPSRQLTQQSAALFALEVVDEDAPADPFDAYQTTSEQMTVAIKDTKAGSGYTVGEQESQQLKIKYTATFLEPNPGKQFDFSESFICKTGQKKILPGFEEGLKVCEKCIPALYATRIGRNMRYPTVFGWGVIENLL
jgi:hypothetical protein